MDKCIEMNDDDATDAYLQQVSVIEAHLCRH